jgi:sigma-B regulation protein RsbU (phosphoserine phosphatase)
MIDDVNRELDACSKGIIDCGRIDADSVVRLRDLLLATDEWINRSGARTLFAINDAISGADNDPGWQMLFVDALTKHFLEAPERPRTLGPEDAKFLMSRIDADGRIDDVELELMVNLCALAEGAPAEFHDYVLAAMKQKVLAEGLIDEAAVDQIRRVIYGPGGSSGEAVDRKEGKLLFDLNDATTGKPNHASWKTLFVEALTSHVLDDARSPGEVDEEEAFWLIERIEADGVYDENELSLLNEIRNRICHSHVWGGIGNARLQIAVGGLTVGIYSRPCEGGKGGDVYYFSVSAGDILTRVAVADVFGHGSAVSDVSKWVYDSLDERMNRKDSHEVLVDLNRQASDHGYEALTTAVVATYSKPDSSLYYSYAGHPPILLRRRSEAQWQPVHAPETDDVVGLPLGAAAESSHEQHRIPLIPRDRVFLYTDGVYEAPNAEGELFGMERLLSVLDLAGSKPVSELIEAVLTALRSHTDDRLDHDDVTFLVLEVR